MYYFTMKKMIRINTSAFRSFYKKNNDRLLYHFTKNHLELFY